MGIIMVRDTQALASAILTNKWDANVVTTSIVLDQINSPEDDPTPYSNLYNISAPKLFTTYYLIYSVVPLVREC